MGTNIPDPAAAGDTPPEQPPATPAFPDAWTQAGIVPDMNPYELAQAHQLYQALNDPQRGVAWAQEYLQRNSGQQQQPYQDPYGQDPGYGQDPYGQQELDQQQLLAAVAQMVDQRFQGFQQQQQQFSLQQQREVEFTLAERQYRQANGLDDYWGSVLSQQARALQQATPGMPADHAWRQVLAQHEQHMNAELARRGVQQTQGTPQVGSMPQGAPPSGAPPSGGDDTIRGLAHASQLYREAVQGLRR